MILHEINHKMAIFRDCTLGEIMCVGVAVFFTLSITLSLMTKLLIGFASIGVLITIICIYPLTKLLLSKLQKLKYGKPYGYYQQLLVRNLLDKGLMKGLYITRIGRWSVRRMK